mmetsp:Transcript_61507/g.109632  ORF Transcript_61507/g.109632 Transcript_61507/m.109632 type:complete len:215 (+) Transcript_61507:374-1018(+)
MRGSEGAVAGAGIGPDWATQGHPVALTSGLLLGDVLLDVVVEDVGAPAGRPLGDPWAVIGAHDVPGTSGDVQMGELYPFLDELAQEGSSGAGSTKAPSAHRVQVAVGALELVDKLLEEGHAPDTLIRIDAGLFEGSGAFVTGGEHPSSVMAEGDENGPGQRGDSHKLVNLIMLLGVSHCISQAQSALSVCVHVLHSQSLVGLHNLVWIARVGIN